jgi:hypothetical protein
MAQSWGSAASIGPREYTCGHCGRAIASVMRLLEPRWTHNHLFHAPLALASVRR